LTLTFCFPPSCKYILRIKIEFSNHNRAPLNVPFTIIFFSETTYYPDSLYSIAIKTN